MSSYEFSEKLETLQAMTSKIVEYSLLPEKPKNISMPDTKSKNMEAVSLLAGGIAHDYSNILTSIIGSASLAMRNMSGNDPSYKYFEQINKMAIKAADLTKQLLLISCKHPIIPTPVNLNIYINELLESMNVLGGHHVNIITHLEKELWKVKADVANTRQILINLLKNACEAMPDGGTLSLKTRNVFFTEEQVISHAGARPGKFVCFFVADTGCGIQEHMIYEIFEPLFTTKEKASGLGLTVVSGVVSHYKGWISVNTLEGKGTEFEIYLPVYEN